MTYEAVHRSLQILVTRMLVHFGDSINLFSARSHNSTFLDDIFFEWNAPETLSRGHSMKSIISIPRLLKADTGLL